MHTLKHGDRPKDNHKFAIFAQKPRKTVEGRAEADIPAPARHRKAIVTRWRPIASMTKVLESAGAAFMVAHSEHPATRLQSVARSDLRPKIAKLQLDVSSPPLHGRVQFVRVATDAFEGTKAMAEPFIGQIMIFAGNFAPQGWAFCNGQSLSISQNTALFSLLGTMYGGDGVSTFALPDLRSRVPIGMGQGPGLSNYNEGQTGGVENVSLQTIQMPTHSHTVNADASTATATSPTGGSLATSSGGRSGTTNVYTTGAPSSPTQLNATTISSTGGGQPHTNLQPYIAMNYIIALQGIYPSRS